MGWFTTTMENTIYYRMNILFFGIVKKYITYLEIIELCENNFLKLYNKIIFYFLHIQPMHVVVKDRLTTMATMATSYNLPYYLSHCLGSFRSFLT